MTWVKKSLCDKEERFLHLSWSSWQHELVYKKSSKKACTLNSVLQGQRPLEHCNWNLFCAQSFSSWSQSSALNRSFLRYRRCHRITWLIAALTQASLTSCVMSVIDVGSPSTEYSSACLDSIYMRWEKKVFLGHLVPRWMSRAWFSCSYRRI